MNWEQKILPIFFWEVGFFNWGVVMNLSLDFTCSLNFEIYVTVTCWYLTLNQVSNCDGVVLEIMIDDYNSVWTVNL